MAADNRFLDDVARMAGGAASLISTIGRQVGSDIKERTAHSRNNTSSSREIERLQATISKFRTEQEQLKKRIEALEAALTEKPSRKPAKAAPPKKPSARPAKKKTGK